MIYECPKSSMATVVIRVPVNLTVYAMCMYFKKKSLLDVVREKVRKVQMSERMKMMSMTRMSCRYG